MSSYLGMCVSRELRSCSTGLAPCKRAFGYVQRGVEGGGRKRGRQGLPASDVWGCVYNYFLCVLCFGC